LLTQKQRQAINLFYEEDFSLSEIAQACACSRQAAHDLIKRSEALLISYEQKMGLVAKYQKQQSLFKKAQDELIALEITAERKDTQAFWSIWKQLISD
ncbi:MAG: hypothetical protein FWG61_01330, partial [Firmicutes bacterium]|nr:hypothetical protein [Bacillota bacterium]